jgi:hypothetical protein
MEFDWQTFSYDEEWLNTAVQLEQSSGWDGEVGVWLSQRQPSAVATPNQVQSMMAQVRLQSILFSELQHWISSWNLGMALEDSLNCARRRLRAHLAEPTEVQQAYLTALLAEDAAQPAQLPIRMQAIEQIKAMLTPQDWQAIAQAEAQSIQEQVMAIELNQVA